MITVKQVLENYDILTEKADNDSKNLVALVHAGLLDESQLPILRRAMSKPAINMTEAEKKALHSLVESVSSCIISEKQDHLSKLDTSRSMGYPPEKDIPAVIILKRKAIRVYPDNQKVALYYSQALDRYISIPYGKNSKALDMTLNESRNLPQILSLLARKKGISANKLSATAIGAIAGRTGQSLGKAQELARQAMGAQENPKEGFGSGYRAGVDYWTKRSYEQNPPKQKSSYEPAPVPEVQGPIKTRFGEPPIKESFRKHLQEKRLQKEGVKDFAFGDIHDTSLSSIAKDFTPYGLGTARSAERTRQSFQKGEYGMAALHGLDTAASGIGDVAFATGIGTPLKGAIDLARGGVRLGTKLLTRGGTKAAEKAAEKTVAKAAEKTTTKTAAKGAEKVTRKPSRTMEWLKRASKRGVLRAAALGAGVAAGAKAAADSVTKDELATPLDSDSYKFTGGTSKVAQTPISGAGRVTQDIAASRAAAAGFGVDLTKKQQQNESNNLNIFKQMVEHNISSHVIHINETPITINNRVAKKVVNVYESLNRQNKRKVEKMLNEDATSFKKIINFAVRQ